MPISKITIDTADAIERLVVVEGGSVTQEAFRYAFGDIAKGDAAIGDWERNICNMVGLSELFCDAIVLLLKQKRIEFRPASLLVCLADAVPMPTNMPWVKRRPPKNGYKQTHFLPVVLYPLNPRFRPTDEERRALVRQALTKVAQSHV